MLRKLRYTTQWFVVLAVLSGTSEAQQNNVFENPFDRGTEQRGSDQQFKSREQAKAEAQKSFQERFPVFSGSNELLQVKDADDELTRLKKERCRTAISECVATLMEFRSGLRTITVPYQSLTRVSASMLALDPDPPTRLAIFKAKVKVAEELEKFAQAKHSTGVGTIQEVYRAQYERLSAQIDVLEEAKRQASRTDE